MLSATPTQKEILINSISGGNLTNPEVAAFKNGGFIVVWESIPAGVSNMSDIYARRFDENNSPLGPEFQVNTPASKLEINPAVATLADGDYIIVWQAKASGEKYGIYGKRFNAYDSQSLISTGKVLDQLYPRVASFNEDGGFVVAWQGMIDSIYTECPVKKYKGDNSEACNDTYLPPSSWGGRIITKPDVTTRSTGEFYVTYIYKASEDWIDSWFYSPTCQKGEEPYTMMPGAIKEGIRSRTVTFLDQNYTMLCESTGSLLMGIAGQFGKDENASRLTRSLPLYNLSIAALKSNTLLVYGSSYNLSYHLYVGIWHPYTWDILNETRAITTPTTNHKAGGVIGLSDGKLVLTWSLYNPETSESDLYMSVLCSDNTACKSETSSRCTSDWMCASCVEDFECSHIPGNNYCNAGTCVECKTTPHCPSPTASKCVSFTCIPCDVDDDCEHLTLTPYCHNIRQSCVECQSNNDCMTPSKSKCEDGDCVGCVNSADCSHLPGNRDFCILGKCMLNSSISIAGPRKIQESDLLLTALINPEEDTLYPGTVYSWNVTGSINGQKPLQDLIDYVATQDSKYLNNPITLLEKEVEYNFSVSYTNVDGVQLSTTHSILPTCPRGIYHISGSGCIGTCIPVCNVCQDSEECIECVSFAKLDSVTKKCVMNSTLTLSGPSSTSTCSDLRSSAIIGPE